MSRWTFNQEPDKIKIIRNDANLKLIRTILKGYAVTKTDYFTVLDPDDYYTAKDKFRKPSDSSKNIRSMPSTPPIPTSKKTERENYGGNIKQDVRFHTAGRCPIGTHFRIDL